jgi:hypothetical protein
MPPSRGRHDHSKVLWGGSRRQEISLKRRQPAVRSLGISVCDLREVGQVTPTQGTARERVACSPSLLERTWKNRGMNPYIKFEGKAQPKDAPHDRLVYGLVVGCAGQKVRAERQQGDNFANVISGCARKFTLQDCADGSFERSIAFTVMSKVIAIIVRHIVFDKKNGGCQGRTSTE